MNTQIDAALNLLYQRQLSSREQLLNEMLRVKLTLKQLEQAAGSTGDKDQLFQFMKKNTEAELGFFPADRDDWLAIFAALKDIDLIDFTIEVYKDDRLGTVLAPTYLTNYILERMHELQPRHILIAEAEKHLAGLAEIIRQFPQAEITLTTQLKPMHLLLQLAFGEHSRVTIRFISIYTDCLPGEQFDYIYALPTFSAKPEEIGRRFITRESDGIALENLLGHLTDRGTLDIIVPARLTFAGLEYRQLRAYITGSYHVQSIFLLPEGTFRPVTAVKTYLCTFTAGPQPHITLGTLELQQGGLTRNRQKLIATGEFLTHPDWRLEMLLADDDDQIRRFKQSALPKVKLKEVAEVFRGKSILKKDTAPGSIAVLNISNIEDGEICYAQLDTIAEEERKIKRYELLTGDVVLSCRGTAIKTAVFTAQEQTIIASANLIVIRPGEKVSGGYLKIFLESPTGLALIKSFQRGTTIMNINNADIMEMEIPLLPLSRQQSMIDKYHAALNSYQVTVKKAASRWSQIKDSIYNELV